MLRRCVSTVFWLRDERASFVGLRYEHELSLRRRALEQFVRATRIAERQALRDDRVDLALTEQLEQRAEILPEPIRVARTSTHQKRSASPAEGNNLVALTQLLDPVGQHPSARRQPTPKGDASGRRVPFDPRSPALAPVSRAWSRRRTRRAVHPAAAPGRSEPRAGRRAR